MQINRLCIGIEKHNLNLCKRKTSVNFNRSGGVVVIYKTQMLKLTKVVEKFIKLFSKNTCNKFIVVVI